MQRVTQKPSWLKAQIPSGKMFFQIKRHLESKNLNTICQKARCPNIAECWNNHNATFLILGKTCSRNCSFCSVKSGNPEPLDTKEADHILQMIEIMKSRYIVITSVTRDDLEDGGSNHFSNVINKLKTEKPGLIIEVLIPDFNNNQDQLNRIFDSQPDVINHNPETIRRLYPEVNRNILNYDRSLNVLKSCRQHNFITKAGIMIGLGESTAEIIELLSDLRESGVQLLTIGQYLQPTKESVKVKRFYTPSEFNNLKKTALDMGFVDVESGPLVRSSYNAEKMYLSCHDSKEI